MALNRKAILGFFGKTALDLFKENGLGMSRKVWPQTSAYIRHVCVCVSVFAGVFLHGMCNMRISISSNG